MKAIDVIRSAMRFVDRFAPPMMEDMRDQPLMQPTPRGGNHPLWVIGHLAYSEAGLYSMIRDEPNPVAHWKEIFAGGTEPTADAPAYPPFDEVYAQYRALRARTNKLLDQLDDADLDRPPTSVSPGLEPHFPTTADVLMAIVLHHENHMGQIADSRRASGRKPIFA